jgi:hypothetical protein
MNKKADTHMWWIIVAAIIAIVVVVFLLIWFRSSGDKAFGNINQNIAGVGDCDGDKVADMFDKCPCDKEVTDKLSNGTTECPKKCPAPLNREVDCVKI